MQKYCFEALDRSLKDIMQSVDPSNKYKPFGGLVIIFNGDFRQILHVIPKGSRQDIVFSAVSSSHQWDSCKVLKLTRNMRLQSGSSKTSFKEVKEFSEWILSVGDGNAGGLNEGEAEIKVSNDILIEGESDPIAAIVESTYPFLKDHLWEPKYFQERAILAPTYEIVEMVNDYVLSYLPGDEKVYLISDAISNIEGNLGASKIYST
ncbi:uncharacterized protein LOC125492733 [Beta vulgaris subsp. vulgaris]|uniref:uncharacterized protein LOC125492733 n=1 Tax=Beta vulgaris subsp. vulgaris TaxID=3555 RepID=UPI002036B62C|nr:uncharacterized protein LOC125492733 [Beta vulgaris subsp. vulgaris]